MVRSTRYTPSLHNNNALTLFSSLSHADDQNIDIFEAEKLIGITQHKDVGPLLRTRLYIEFARVLGMRQFPDKGGELPDSEGRFVCPPPFSENNPLLPRHTVVPPEHAHQLDQMQTFDRLSILQMQRNTLAEAQRLVHGCPAVVAAPSAAAVAAAAPAAAAAAKASSAGKGQQNMGNSSKKAANNDGGAQHALPAKGKQGQSNNKKSNNQDWDTGTQRDEDSEEMDQPIFTQQAFSGFMTQNNNTQLLTQSALMSQSQTQNKAQAGKSGSKAVPSGSGKQAVAASSSSSSKAKAQAHAPEQPLLLTQAGMPLSPIDGDDDAILVDNDDDDDNDDAGTGRRGARGKAAAAGPTKAASSGQKGKPPSKSPGGRSSSQNASRTPPAPKDPESLVDRKIRKNFGAEHGWYDGIITSWRTAPNERREYAEEPLYNIYFEKDGDEEELFWEELHIWLLPFDDVDLTQPQLPLVPRPQQQQQQQQPAKRSHEEAVKGSTASASTKAASAAVNSSKRARTEAPAAASAAVVAASPKPLPSAKKPTAVAAAAVEEIPAPRVAPPVSRSSVILAGLRSICARPRTTVRDKNGLLIVCIPSFSPTFFLSYSLFGLLFLFLTLFSHDLHFLSRL
jgi:hypothetical protein